MEEKICNKCGYHNKIDSSFCTGCGNALEEFTTNKQNNIQYNSINNQANNIKGDNQKTNGFAIASLVLGIISVTLGLFVLSIWFPLLAISFSVVAKQKIKAFNQSGNGLATAGLVLGIIGFVFLVINVILEIMVNI